MRKWLQEQIDLHEERLQKVDSISYRNRLIAYRMALSAYMKHQRDQEDYIRQQIVILSMAEGTAYGELKHQIEGQIIAYNLMLRRMEEV